MVKIDIDVYLSGVKNFFEKNTELFATIVGDMDTETFFERVREIANKNYDSNGDPTLTIKQLESISNVKFKVLPERPKIVDFSVTGKNFKFSSN